MDSWDAEAAVRSGTAEVDRQRHFTEMARGVTNSLFFRTQSSTSWHI